MVEVGDFPRNRGRPLGAALSSVRVWLQAQVVTPFITVKGIHELPDLSLGDGSGVVDHLIGDSCRQEDAYDSMVCRSALYLLAMRAGKVIGPSP